MTEQALIGLSILEIIALNSGQKINKNKTNKKQTNYLLALESEQKHTDYIGKEALVNFCGFYTGRELPLTL